MLTIMKKITKKICCLGLVFLSIVSLQAQEKHTFYVGYGLETHESFADHIQGISVYLGSLGNLSLTNESYSGAIFAGYRMAITERFEVGGLIAYERMSGNLRVFDITHRTNQDIYAFMGEARYNYITRPNFRLYSGAAAGLSIHSIIVHDESSERENELEEAFHVDAIGVSFGKKFAPFLSVGWGYKGFINVGLQARF